MSRKDRRRSTRTRAGGNARHGSTTSRETAAALVAWLSEPRTHAGAAVSRLETHISHVFLVGELAFKLKKAVRLPFLDYSSLVARRRMAVRELLINRLHAPEIYLGLMPVLNDGGTDPRQAERMFRFGPLLHLEEAPAGAAVEEVLGDERALDALVGGWARDARVRDWLVVMRRFADEERFDRLAAAGALGAHDIRELADELAFQHRRAAVRRDMGGAKVLANGFADVVATLKTLPASPWTAGELEDFSGRVGACLTRLRGRLETRRRLGMVRRCHGDLHLANICRFGGRVRTFDAIEFSDEIGVIDIAHDAAFPVMDLIARDRRQAANHLFNRYLEAVGDDAALDLWPLLIALRATVRAMASAGGGEPAQATRYRAVAEAALELSRRRRPLWIAIGGLSGSGKSTVARILAPLLHCPPGGLWLRSDGIRKRLFGRAPEERLPAGDAYAPAAHARTYRRLLARARLAARAGWPAILDATWLDGKGRARLGRLAERLAVPLHRFWIDAPPSVLRERVAARRGDASDAGPTVLEEQIARFDGVPEGWVRLRGEGTAEDLAARILAAVRSKP